MIDAGEREAILAEFDRLGAEPLPAGKGLVALLVGAAGLFLLIGVPRLLHPSGVAATAVLVLSFVLLALSILLAAFGRSASSTWSGRAEDAIAWLVAEYPGEPDERRRAAVGAIYYAFLREGQVPTYDFQAAAQQLGPALEYVQAVERLLREAKRPVRPVFTA